MNKIFVNLQRSEIQTWLGREIQDPGKYGLLVGLPSRLHLQVNLDVKQHWRDFSYVQTSTMHFNVESTILQSSILSVYAGLQHQPGSVPAQFPLHCLLHLFVFFVCLFVC